MIITIISILAILFLILYLLERSKVLYLEIQRDIYKQTLDVVIDDLRRINRIKDDKFKAINQNLKLIK